MAKTWLLALFVIGQGIAAQQAKMSESPINIPYPLQRDCEKDGQTGCLKKAESLQPWAEMKSSTGSIFDSSARTLTISLQDGVLCTMVFPPQSLRYDIDPQSFTLTCIKPTQKRRP